MENTRTPLDYDARLARSVREGETDHRRSAVTLFERRQPKSLSEAVDLVVPYGSVPPEIFDRIAVGYDVYRHARDMPTD